MKILIAEDDRISRLLMQRILEADGGHALTMANDGEEAWQQLLASPEPFDVCLLDIMMPRLDGLGLIARMRASRPSRSFFAPRSTTGPRCRKPCSCPSPSIS
jgi:CheY-like chemotaxis protein